MNRARGRPRSFDSDAALRIVSQTFHVGGFAATSLDDIASTTGLQRPSLYAAFGDKKSMYVRSLQLLKADIEAVVDDVEAQSNVLGTRLAKLFARSISSYCGGNAGPLGCLAICTASTEAANDKDIRDALGSILEQIDGRVAAWFAEAGYADAMGNARLVSATMHSISVRARAGQRRAVLEQMAEDAVRLTVTQS